MKRHVLAAVIVLPLLTGCETAVLAVADVVVARPEQKLVLPQGTLVRSEPKANGREYDAVFTLPPGRLFEDRFTVLTGTLSVSCYYREVTVSLRSGKRAGSGEVLRWGGLPGVLPAAEQRAFVEKHCRNFQPKRVKDLPVSTFTVLDASVAGEWGIAYWLDEDHLLTELVPPGARRPRERDPEGRIVLIDVKRQSVTTIAQDAALVSFEPSSREAYVGRWKLETGLLDETYPVRHVRIGPDGTFIELGRHTERPLPSLLGEMPKTSAKVAWRRGAGWFLPEPLPREEVARRSQHDEPVLTRWIRPGRPELALPVRYEEIGSVEYVEFLGKFLLNDVNPQMSSSTNSHANRVWTRPYEFTPFRLLADDGSIEEIAFPSYVFDYGLDEANRPGGGQLAFTQFVLTRKGQLISRSRSGASALYLYSGDQLYRLVQRNGIASFGVPAENAAFFKVSPSGCRVAYTHADTPYHKFDSPRYVTVLDLCR